MLRHWSAVLIMLAGLIFPLRLHAADAVQQLSFACRQGGCEQPPAADGPALQSLAMRPEFRADPISADWDRYQMALSLDPQQQRVSGALRIAHTNRGTRSYDTIWLHAYPNHPDVRGSLQLSAVYIDGRPVERILRDNAVLIGLPLAAPLLPGASLTIDLGFVTTSPLNASRSAFGAFNREAGVWALGTFYPILARYDDRNGWDTRPVDSRGDFAVSSTALYDVTIDAPADWQIVGTGSAAAPVQPRAERYQHHLVSGPQREFFLAALQGLEERSTEVDGTLVRSFVRPGNAPAAQRSLQVAADALRVFNQQFGPYPFREMVLIEAALTYFYGMEYPGVMLIDSGLYRRNDQAFETTIAHEVAHQWWYGLVGSDAQGEAWLDEGLASYAEVVYYRATARPEQAEQQLAGFRRSWLAVRDGVGDAPLVTPPAGLARRYVAVVYSKGALFIDALQREIGTEAFERFLRAYAAEARYRDATSGLLLDQAALACACDVTAFAEPWLFGINPPLP